MARRDEERRKEMLEAFEGFASKGGFRDKVDHITSEEVAKRMGDGDLVVVDVRPDKLRAVSRIPGSMSQKEFEDKRAGDASFFQGKTVVTSCTIGFKAGLFALSLVENSKDLVVKNHVGSMMDWCHEGGDLVDGKGEATKNVHGMSEDLVKYFPHAKGYNIVTD